MASSPDVASNWLSVFVVFCDADGADDANDGGGVCDDACCVGGGVDEAEFVHACAAVSLLVDDGCWFISSIFFSIFLLLLFFLVLIFCVFFFLSKLFCFCLFESLKNGDC